ncbi:MAG: TolB family protein, partial [Steroidobacteraceae bacterium]
MLRTAVVAVVLGLTYASTVSTQSAQPTAPMEMRAFFSGRWTYQPRWSPDGRMLAYLQDDWDRQQLFVVPASGGTPRQLSKAERFIGDPRTGSAGQAPQWSPDGQEILYVQDGDLQLVNVADGRVVALTSTQERESNPT